MARQEFHLGAADGILTLADRQRLTWSLFNSIVSPDPVAGALLADASATAYLALLRVDDDRRPDRENVARIRLLTADLPGITDAAAAGPQLSDAWEISPVAITLTAGHLELTLPGPRWWTILPSAFLSTDEPYTIPYSGDDDTALRAFIAAWLDLPPATQAQTTLILDDGITGPVLYVEPGREQETLFFSSPIGYQPIPAADVPEAYGFPAGDGVWTLAVENDSSLPHNPFGIDAATGAVSIIAGLASNIVWTLTMTYAVGEVSLSWTRRYSVLPDFTGSLPPTFYLPASGVPTPVSLGVLPLPMGVPPDVHLDYGFLHPPDDTFVIGESDAGLLLIDQATRELSSTTLSLVVIGDRYWIRGAGAIVEAPLDIRNIPLPTLDPSVGLFVVTHAPAGTTVGVAATPSGYPDDAPPGVWTFAANGNPGGQYVIDAATGLLTVAAGLNANIDQTSVRVRYERASIALEADVAIALQDVYQPTLDLATTAIEYRTDAADGDILGVAGAASGFPPGTAMWSIGSFGQDGAIIGGGPYGVRIDPGTGAIIATGRLPAFAVQPDPAPFMVRIYHAVGSVFRVGEITIQLRVIPIVTQPAAAVALENAATGSAVPLALVTDHAGAATLTGATFAGGALSSGPFAFPAPPAPPQMDPILTAPLDFETTDRYELELEYRFDINPAPALSHVVRLSAVVEVGDVIDGPPQILLAADLSVEEGGEIATTTGIRVGRPTNFPTAADGVWALSTADGDVTSFSPASRPGVVSIDPATGYLTTTDTAETAATPRLVPLTIRYTRGGVTATAAATLTIRPGPRVTATPNLTIRADAVRYEIIGAAATAANFPAGEGRWTITPGPFGEHFAGGFLFLRPNGDFIVWFLRPDATVVSDVSAIGTVRTVTVIYTVGDVSRSAEVSVEVTAPTGIPGPFVPGLEPSPDTDTPHLVATGTLTVRQDAPTGTVIGTVASPRNFPAGAAAWSFVGGGDTDGPFRLHAETGVLSVSSSVAGLSGQYAIEAQLQQGGATAEIVREITIIDADTVAAGAITRHYAAWLVSLPDTTPPLHVWSGDGELTLDGVTFQGFGSLLSVGDLHSELSQPVRQMTIQLLLSSLPQAIRTVFLADPGPRRVEVGQIVSTDGRSWIRVPRTFRGRLSAPRLRSDAYQIDVVTRVADIDRGAPRFWSDETQRARHPLDRGLEYMRDLAAGVDIRWPP